MAGCLRHGTQSNAPSLSGVDAADQTPHTEGSSSGPRVRGQAAKRTPSPKKIFPVSGLWKVIHYEIVYCTASSVPFS
jgi:hypothetical protein